MHKETHADHIRSWGFRSLDDSTFHATFGPLLWAWAAGDVDWLVQEVLLLRTQGRKTPDQIAASEEFQRARAAALAEGCACSTRNQTLCRFRTRDGMYACTRLAGHSGHHVACAGSEGPHGIAAWCPL